jgi:hypothetical protein
VPERARRHLEALKALRNELERVKAEADALIDRVAADLNRVERDVSRPSEPPEPQDPPDSSA